MTNYMLILVTALIFAIGATPLARRLAPYLGVMDQPSTRKIHTKAMPRLGGAAIYLAFILALLLLGDRAYVSQGASILLGATLVSFCGIWDDRWGMRPLLKLGIGQPLAALILVASGIRVNFLPHPILNILVTIIWVVGITSALNLLDNMDGLSAGVATVASAFFLLLAAMSGQYLVGSLAAALLGACLGFLLYNFNPASIFMGDTGSLFIGFVLAAVGIKLRFPGRMDIVTWMIPVLVLGVPIFDTTLVVVSRLRRGLNPTTHPGKDHFSHRLVAMGLSQREAVMAICLICGTLGMLAVFLTQASVVEGYAIGVVVILAGLFELWKLERVKGLE
ncbi:MAG: undecaprenyl/decaprenyl-phosphate alpha-N-acetylglucosaminyl 1-phosphate transferase [Anaerolineales bacterium]|nr:undecaprenyl/decaprenyl-phosphate alpha-N-acetylglucosaminyl 1-phosphate transferase [Anaerolineales bacterium]